MSMIGKYLSLKRGFSLVSAVFILVILSLTGVYALKLSSNTNAARVLSNDGIRAYFAANSGLEWGLYQVINNPSACPPTTTLSLSQGGLVHFQTVVSCSMSSFTESSNNYNIFTITSAASRGQTTDFDYVTVTLISTLTTAP